MSEALNFPAGLEQTVEITDTNPIESSAESDPLTPEETETSKPTALNRLSNLLLDLSIKTESADTKFNNFKAETSENLKDTAEKAKETFKKIGRSTLNGLATAGYIGVGLGVIGAKATAKGVINVKNKAAEGVAVANNFVSEKYDSAKSNTINIAHSTIEYGAKGVEATTDAAKYVYESATEKGNNLKDLFIQKGLEAKQAKIERIANKEAEKRVKEQFVYEKAEQEKADRINAAEQLTRDRIDEANRVEAAKQAKIEQIAAAEAEKRVAEEQKEQLIYAQAQQEAAARVDAAEAYTLNKIELARKAAEAKQAKLERKLEYKRLFGEIRNNVKNVGRLALHRNL